MYIHCNRIYIHCVSKVNLKLTFMWGIGPAFTSRLSITEKSFVNRDLEIVESRKGSSRFWEF